MNRTQKLLSYEDEVLAVLAFEFDVADQAESECKIKRRLRDKKLSPYDQERFDTIRKIKDEVIEELGKSTKSKI